MFSFEAVPDFDFSSKAYAILCMKAERTAFQHPVWQVAIQRHLQSLHEVRPLTLVIRHVKSGALALVLSLIQKRRGPLRVFEYANLGFVDYACAVIDRDFWLDILSLPELAMRVNQCLAPYNLLWIKHIREDNLKILGLFDHARANEAGFSAHAAHMGADFMQWKRDALSANRRSQLQRKRKAFNKAGRVSFSILTDEQTIASAFCVLRRMRNKRFHEKSGCEIMQDEKSYNFYLTLAQNNAASGFAMTSMLTLDDEPVAIVFGLHDGARYYYLLPGADYQRFGSYSPGQIMLDYLMEAAHQRGVEVFDFTIGDENYKTSFGTHATPIYTLSQTSGIVIQSGLNAALYAHRLLKSRKSMKTNR